MARIYRTSIFILCRTSLCVHVLYVYVWKYRWCMYIFCPPHEVARRTRSLRRAPLAVPTGQRLGPTKLGTYSVLCSIEKIHGDHSIVGSRQISFLLGYSVGITVDWPISNSDSVARDSLDFSLFFTWCSGEFSITCLHRQNIIYN